MEYNQSLDKNSGTTLIITPEIRNFLKEAAKWANILAIIGFILLGFMVLSGLFMLFFMGSLTSTMAEMSQAGGQAYPYPGDPAAMTGTVKILSVLSMLFYLFLVALYFFPILYLYRFATKTKAALNADNQIVLSEAFKNLKSLYKFIGILAIFFILFYILMFLLSAVTALSFASTLPN